MLGFNSNKRNLRAIATPVISFVLLGILVVGAVLFGNLVVERADECRPLGSSAEGDGASLLVYSDEEDALMLCNASQDTVKYDPPQRDRSEVGVGEGLIRLHFEDDMGPGKMAGIEGYFSYERNIRGTPVYAKGEFGSLDDCGFFGESLYESDDFDGFDGSDMFHPDRIQSCWVEVEIESLIDD